MAAKRKAAGRKPAKEKSSPAAAAESADRRFRGVLIRVDAAGLRELRLLAVHLDRRLQSLGIEALNDLLEKYGRKPAVRNPLLRAREG